jgi:P27 family predicted phage terminase small subunit
MTGERKRGPKPKPARPTPLKGRPEPPVGLDALAAKHWDDTVAAAERAGMLSLLDRDALTAYIHIWITYRQARKMIDRPRAQGGGCVVDTDRGPRRSEWYQVMLDARRDMVRYLDRFGLTPLGRSKLKMEAADPDPDGKWAAFEVLAGD